MLTVHGGAFAAETSGADSLGVIEMADEAGYGAEDSLPAIERMPQLQRFVEAEYPVGLQKQGIEGVVVLDLLVSDSGTVDSAAVVRGLTEELDSAAMRAARQFRFSPAVADGEAVSVLLQYEYRFSLRSVIDSIQPFVNFSGRLLESGTRQPLADAMVVLTFSDTAADTRLPVPFSLYRERIGAIPGQYLEEGRLVTMTDSSGQFRFLSLPACSVVVSCVMAGYESMAEPERITADQALTATYYLRRLSYADYEIVVYGRAEQKEVSRRQLTLQEVRKIPGFSGDAVKVVQALPGVARPQFGTGEIVVRGAPTWDSRFYLDGTRIPLLYHFGGVKSVYNSEALESVNFYPGGFGVRHGGAVGGVIEIEGRRPKTDRWHGQVDLSALDGSVLIEGALTKNISVLGTARRSFMGDLLSYYFKHSTRDYPFSVLPFYWDYVLRTDIALPKDNHVFVTLFGGRDSLALIVPGASQGSEEVDKAADRMRMKVTFHDILAGWDYKGRRGWENSLRYSFTTAASDWSVFGAVAVDERALMHHLRNNLSYEFGKKLKAHAGLDLNLIDENLILAIPGNSGAVMRDTSKNWLYGVLGGYVQADWRPLDNLLIVPGLRYDFFPELDYNGAMLPEFWKYHAFDNVTRYSGEPSARLTARYGIAEHHTAKLAIGNYSQTPQPIGQTIHKTWGVPTMPATKAAHYVIGYEWRITDLISADVQGYINRQFNVPEMETSEDLDQSGSSQLWRHDGKARMRGVEVMLRHDQGRRFFGWLAYTLARSERLNRTSGKFELYSQDETHNVQAVASWRLPRNWDVGLRGRYVTGKPTTPVIGVEESENFNYFKPLYGKTNSARLDPFFQIDLRVDKKYVFERWMLSTYLDIQNLSWLFYKSPEMEYYNYDYTDKNRISMPIMPSIGIKAEF